MNDSKIIFDSATLLRSQSVITIDNSSFKYGYGCFETMRLVNGRIPLAELHFERLFNSLEVLRFDIPDHLTARNLLDQSIQLAIQNQCIDQSKIRITISREFQTTHYIIEAEALSTKNAELNKDGLVIDIYTKAIKNADIFSHIKSNARLQYEITRMWANEKKLDDAIIMNSSGKIVDSTIANLFIVSGGIIKTPPIEDGCVSGVMRKYLLRCCRQQGLPIQEVSLSIEDVLQAQEVFLTNAVRGIQWVKQVAQSGFQLNTAKLLSQKFIQPLFI